MKTTVTFPETARTSLKTLILRLGEVVLSGAALAALLFLVVSASAARETSADASNSVPDGGRQATAMAVDPPCGMPDGISIDHMESAWGWHFSSSDLTVTVTPTIVSGLNGQALRLDYNLGTAKGAWVQMRRDYSSGLDISGGDHLRFYYRGTITNTLEVGVTSGEPRNYFASFWNSVTQVPWWTYATWDYRDFLLGDQQPFPDFSDVRAIYISVANKDGDVGGVGSLIIDELQYVSVAARTVPSDFEPVTVPPTVTQKAADWIAARQQPSGLLKSWQEEYQDYAWLYDQALGLIVLSETDLSKAGQLADTLHALHNPDGSWYNGYHFTTMLPVDDTRKPVGANAWLVYALMRYYWRSGNQTALQDALEGAAWLATLQRSDGSLPGEVSGTGAGTEPNLSAWWAFRAAGYRAQADRLRAYLTEQAWDSSLGRFNSSGANYPPRGRYEILLDNQTWGAAFLHAIGREEDARRALSYARWTLLVDPPRRDMCGFGGSGPLSVWNEGTLQYVAAHGENSQYYVDRMVTQQAADGGLPGSPDDFAGFANRKEWLTRMHGVAPTAWLYFAGTGGPFSPTPEEKIRMEADYILACQYTGPGPAHGAINDIYGLPTYVVPSENAMAILGLDLATQRLADPVYRARAETAANYLVSVQQPDGAWCDQYDYATCVDPARSPRQTAEVMMTLHRLGYDHNRYAAMKHGAEYLFACQDVANKGGNPLEDDGLVGGGKDRYGQWHHWRWTHDNAYAYWGLKAAQHWAAIEDDIAFHDEVAARARRILEGVDRYLADPTSPAWYIAVDANDVPLKNPHLPCLPSTAPAYPSWIQYAPQMLDLPVPGVNLPAVGEWIYQTFTPADGSGPGSLGYTCDPWESWPNGEFRLRKYPGFAFQAALSWFDTGHTAYANAAIAWAETSGLWQTTPDPVNHVTGGFVDWIEIQPEPGLMVHWWERYIDTSFYAIACWNNGYDFGIAHRRLLLPIVLKH